MLYQKYELPLQLLEEYELTQVVRISDSYDVFVGVLRQNGERYLITVSSQEKHHLLKKDKNYGMIPKSIYFFKSMKNRGILKFVDLFQNDSCVCTVTEIGGFENAIQESTSKILPEVYLQGGVLKERARIIFRQIIHALDYMEKNGLIHDQITLDSVMIAKDHSVKISNFEAIQELPYIKKNYFTYFHGMSLPLQFQDYEKPLEGNILYAPPELFYEYRYKGPQVQSWNLGVILFILVTGSFPFNSVSDILRYNINFSVGSSQFDTWSRNDACINLIKAMLQPNPEKRLGLLQIKKHPWLNFRSIYF